MPIWNACGIGWFRIFGDSSGDLRPIAAFWRRVGGRRAERRSAPGRGGVSPLRGIPACAGMTGRADLQQRGGTAPFLPGGLGLSPRPRGGGALVFNEYAALSADILAHGATSPKNEESSVLK